MRRILLAFLITFLMLLPVSGADETGTIYGFTTASTRVERGWEDKFKAIPDPKVLRDAMQWLTAHSHHVGSPYDKQNAEWILSKFKK